MSVGNAVWPVEPFHSSRSCGFPFSRHIPCLRFSSAFSLGQAWPWLSLVDWAREFVEHAVRYRDLRPRNVISRPCRTTLALKFTTLDRPCRSSPQRRQQPMFDLRPRRHYSHELGSRSRPPQGPNDGPWQGLCGSVMGFGIKPSIHGSGTRGPAGRPVPTRPLPPGAGSRATRWRERLPAPARSRPG